MKLSFPKISNNLAYRLASQQLAGTIDIEELCRKSGAQYHADDSRKSITVKYLNQPYLVTLPDVEISRMGSPEAVPVRDGVLILHYLLNARGTPLSDKLIAFHELPEGNLYYPAFVKRTIQPLVDNFGTAPQLLLDMSSKMGGLKTGHGDIAVTIYAFPRIPITIVLWGSDNEFPARGNVLFDVTISHYLPAEDITVLCETIIWRLVGLKRSA